MNTTKETELLRRELTAVRIENARFHRMAEDLLYNLDGENMPAVERRIKDLEGAVLLLYSGEGVDEAMLKRAFSDALGILLARKSIAIPTEEGEEGAYLSSTELRLPHVYRNPASRLDGLRPLYMDGEGRIVALEG